MHIHAACQIAIAPGDVPHAAGQPLQRQDDLVLQHPPRTGTSDQGNHQHDPTCDAGTRRRLVDVAELALELNADRLVQRQHCGGQVPVVRGQRDNLVLQLRRHILLARH